MGRIASNASAAYVVVVGYEDAGRREEVVRTYASIMNSLRKRDSDLQRWAYQQSDPGGQEMIDVELRSGEGGLSCKDLSDAR